MSDSNNVPPPIKRNLPLYEQAHIPVVSGKRATLWVQGRILECIVQDIYEDEDFWEVRCDHLTAPGGTNHLIIRFEK